MDATSQTTSRSLIETLRTLADQAGPDGMTLHELFEALGERAFGAMLFALALPCCIPFLYGVPQVVAVPMMAIALQMAAGRPEPWLPKKLGERRIDQKGLLRMANGASRYFGWLERFSARRLQILAGPVAERLVGAVLVVFCASILTPLPATNTTPGIAVALTAYGLMERDGLLVSFGLVVGVAWVAFLVAVAVLAWSVLTDPNSGTTDVIRTAIDVVRGWLPAR